MEGQQHQLLLLNYWRTSKSSNKVVFPGFKVKNPHAHRNLGNDANFVVIQNNNRTDNLMQ